MNRTIRTSLTAAALVGASLVCAGAGAQRFDPAAGTYHEYARVISATPLYDRVNEPERRCHVEVYPNHREAERCTETTVTRDVMRGYRVVYSYDGRQFTTELPYDPGVELRVDVNVMPVIE